MKIERILRVTATVETTISEDEYKKARAEDGLEEIAMRRLQSRLWTCDRALYFEIGGSDVMCHVLHQEYNLDKLRLLSTIMVEISLITEGLI